MNSFYFLPEMPGVSIAVWIAASMVFLFFAREPVHKMIQAFSDATAGGLRKMAEWTKNTAKAMREKDRKVLLESGVAKIQGEILQEFSKIDMANTKNLAGYPKLQLKLDDNISQIERDYQECGQITPEAPGWSEVIESIGKAQGSTSDRIIEGMLAEIHKSAVDGEKKALTEFREVSAKRHKILGSMAPVWKRVEKLGKEINNQVEKVMENSRNIEKYMTRYEKISAAEPESIDLLSSKVTKLFIISLIVIFVGLVGAFINFNLIALPMSELVPAGVRVAGMAVSEISALVIVALELVLGIFLFEAIGVTHTFPQISNMTRGKRKIILSGCLLGLLFLSTVEASLAILRENLAETSSAPPNSGPWPRAPTEFRVSAPTNSTITLDWIPPTTYTDGTALTTIDGYVIRWTLFPDDDWLASEYVYVQNPGLTSYVMDLPAPGVWYLMIFTHADGGKGGPPSDMVNVEIL